MDEVGRIPLKTAVKRQLQTLKSETAFYYGEVVEVKGVKFTITRMNNSTLCISPNTPFRHFAGILLVEQEAKDVSANSVTDSGGADTPPSGSVAVGRDGQYDVPVPSDP